MTESTFTISFRRRPWWAWLLAVLWLALLGLLLQTAVASGAEEEPRAAAISWVITAVLTLVGGLAWRRIGRSGEQRRRHER